MTRTVFITGVLGGIGSAIAQAFKEGGYFVYGADVRQATDPQHVDKFFTFDLHTYCVNQTYQKDWNRKFNDEIEFLDVLVNNAATQLLDHLADVKLSDWQETLNVNLTGPMLLSQYFLKTLEERNGSIINIASIHQQLTKPRFVSYATSKSALVGLTKALAVDLEGRVRVNSISPAAIQTPMLLAGFDGKEEALEQLKKLHPVQRIGYPFEVAKLAVFLASENFGFVHGANITLDGGISSVLKDL
jgi:NAD(P)-dependent dehydrogenase (short-subunit alcohol dehydrogenase family)